MTRPLVLHCLDGLGVGGAERQLVLLLRHLAGGPFEHAVCRLGGHADLAGEIVALGVPVYHLSAGRRNVMLAVPRLFRLVRRVRPALIHADHDYAKLCARLVGARTRIPVLETKGNTALPGGRTRRRMPARFLKLRLLRWVISAAGGVGPTHRLAISRTVKESLVAAGVPAESISVVYRGLDLAQFTPDDPALLAALRRSLVPIDAGPLLLHVGRLVHQKQQDLIIRALPAVAQVHPRVRLLLAGEGPHRERYRALAEAEGVAHLVQFLGLRRDVKLLLQLADLYLFPSRREGTGVALLEAMAMGRACIVSRIPVLEEVAGGEGAALLVEPGRSDLLAEAILTLLADPARRAEMGRRAREVVRERFDIRRSADEFTRVCRQLLEGAPAGRMVEGVA